jgi:exodeoxyribonuclease VII small subunit
MALDKNSYESLQARLDEITAEVRDKETSLERSLDLYEEAIELGMRATELIDRADTLSPDAINSIVQDEVEDSEIVDSDEEIEQAEEVEAE